MRSAVNLVVLKCCIKCQLVACSFGCTIDRKARKLLWRITTLLVPGEACGTLSASSGRRHDAAAALSGSQPPPAAAISCRRPVIAGRRAGPTGAGSGRVGAARPGKTDRRSDPGAGRVRLGAGDEEERAAGAFRLYGYRSR